MSWYAWWIARIVLAGMGSDAPAALDLTKAGASMLAEVATRGDESLTLVAHDGSAASAAALVEGAAMRSYRFDVYRTRLKDDQKQSVTALVGACDDPAAGDAAMNDVQGRLAGHYLARDLKHEPANILYPVSYAQRLKDELEPVGVEVTIIDEKQMEKEGWGALLGVGQGSIRDSAVVVMHWKGDTSGVNKDPVCFVGKGVTFDTGGISIKPAGGMEEMTMDMGGAGVVSGVMKTLALRKAKANVVGVVGIVENMPSGNAVRPGDVVTSMKGDKIEVVNTDAEGRLVLSDVLWYTQERFRPVGMINLATLTGAIIIALGHENAGVFSNSDDLSGAFIKAASAEGEGAWRMPLSAAYDKMINCRIADMRNTGGGRDAGSITAAQFLARFVKPETPWAHLDIAGVASIKGGTKLAPAGATGWGVMALNRLISDRYEA